MKVNIYSIAKPSNDEFDKIAKDLIRNSSKFAKIETHTIFNKKISKAQTISSFEAKKSYTEAFIPYMNGYNIALDLFGKKLDSFKFSKLLEDKPIINFFIGGAYGFEKEFLSKCDTIISLSDLTMAHKIANIVLLEQIFRGLSIINNHPYHK